MYTHNVIRLLSRFAILPIMLGITACTGDDLTGSDGIGTEDTTNSEGVIVNPGIIAQKNFSILADDAQPPVFDAVAMTATDTSVVITVKIGDRNNQLLTDPHEVFFATEWGLIEPSCTTTDNGTCSVTWQTSFGVVGGGSSVPAGNLTTITAWTLGEENFTDFNGDGLYTDAGMDTAFDDREEPYVDAVPDGGGFNILEGDVIIDVMNGNDLGSNGAHDGGDMRLNSPACNISTAADCSPTRSTIYIWTDIELDMNGPPP